ncbi:MAG: hypothetical protein WD768_13935 [Phycisphaeraceae bacterium]
MKEWRLLFSVVGALAMLTLLDPIAALAVSSPAKGWIQPDAPYAEWRGSFDKVRQERISIIQRVDLSPLKVAADEPAGSGGDLNLPCFVGVFGGALYFEKNPMLLERLHVKDVRSILSPAFSVLSSVPSSR